MTPRDYARRDAERLQDLMRRPSPYQVEVMLAEAVERGRRLGYAQGARAAALAACAARGDAPATDPA